MIVDPKHELILQKQKLYTEKPIDPAIRLLPAKKRLSFDAQIDKFIDDIPFPEDFTKTDLKSVMIDELKSFVMDRIREIEDLIDNVVSDREKYDHDTDVLMAHNLDLAAHNLDELYLKLNSNLNECQMALNGLIEYKEEVKEMYTPDDIKRIKDLADKKGLVISDSRAIEIAEHFKNSNLKDISKELDLTEDDWEIPDERE